MNWIEYWSQPGFDDEFRSKSLELYTGKIVELVSLKGDENVLDYGAGPGFLAQYLAPRVRHLVLMEPAEVLREKSMRDTASLRNVSHVDPRNEESLTGCFAHHSFDLVLINSVIQYLSPGKTQRILLALHQSLKPGGTIVISDIVADDSSLLADLLSVMHFYRQWFPLRRFLRYVATEFRNLRKRSGLPFQKYSRRSFECLVTQAYSVSWVANPTICAGRMCAVLTPRREWSRNHTAGE